MQHQFWFDRWQNNEIGFHQTDGQPLLRKHWSALELPASARVLVPLCGKTRDMAWLAEQGHAVTGIELSETAASDFFAESGVDYVVRQTGAFSCFSGGGIDILVGDFFELPAEQLAGFDAWYDRAALIALPPDMRQRYVDRLMRHLQPGTRGLLITFAYDPSVMDGPPFSVDDDAVHALMSGYARLEQLEQRRDLSIAHHLQRRGLSEARDSVYRLTVIDRE